MLYQLSQAPNRIVQRLQLIAGPGPRPSVLSRRDPPELRDQQVQHAARSACRPSAKFLRYTSSGTFFEFFFLGSTKSPSNIHPWRRPCSPTSCSGFLPGTATRPSHIASSTKNRSVDSAPDFRSRYASWNFLLYRLYSMSLSRVNMTPTPPATGHPARRSRPRSARVASRPGRRRLPASSPATVQQAPWPFAPDSVARRRSLRSRGHAGHDGNGQGQREEAAGHDCGHRVRIIRRTGGLRLRGAGRAVLPLPDGPHHGLEAGQDGGPLPDRAPRPPTAPTPMVSSRRAASEQGDQLSTRSICTTAMDVTLAASSVRRVAWSMSGRMSLRIWPARSRHLTRRAQQRNTNEHLGGGHGHQRHGHHAQEEQLPVAHTTSLRADSYASRPRSMTVAMFSR